MIDIVTEKLTASQYLKYFPIKKRNEPTDVTYEESGESVKIGDTIYDINKDEYYDVVGCDNQRLLLIPNRIQPKSNTTNYRTINMKVLPSDRFSKQGNTWTDLF